MREMRFDVPCVRACLVRERQVCTVRGYFLSDGEVLVSGVGVCLRKRLGEVVRKDDLFKYLPFSGFTGIDAWWQAIRRFVTNDRKLWLYVVRVSKR